MFISWIKYHGRSADLARALGIEAVFIEGGAGNPLRRYLRQWTTTRRLIREASPSSIIVMQPPLPALLAVVSTSEGRRAMVIGDLHTGALENPKWRWASRPMLRILKKRGFAVVTNAPLAERVTAAGATAVVLNDLIPTIPAGLSNTFDDPGLAETASSGFVLVPLAYANDEPVDALLRAAALEPQITWVLTGRAPESVRAAAPANIRFTGYVSNDDYTRLLQSADVVAALTDREYTMQRAGYEALGAGRALVTGDTRTLRAYFGDSALYMDGTSASIARSVRDAVDRSADLAQGMATLRVTKVDEERESLDRLRALLVSGSDGR